MVDVAENYLDEVGGVALSFPGAKPDYGYFICRILSII